MSRSHYERGSDMQDQQHADDIGDQINEMEVAAWHDVAPVPVVLTDEMMVGALIAEAKCVIDDLSQPEHVKVLVDTTREELATSLHDLDRMLQLLGVIRDEVAQTLAGLMEADAESIAGLAVTRQPSGDKTEWDRSAARVAVRMALIDRWARAGDEVDPIKVDVIERVSVDMALVYPSANPTVNGLQALGVNPYDYRAVTKGTRWAVKVS